MFSARFFFVISVFIVLLAGCGSSSSDTTSLGKQCESNSECESEQYCHFAEGDCGANAGECARRTEVCTMIYAPVCGCDGKTYGSDCGAAGEGVSISKQGECEGS